MLNAMPMPVFLVDADASILEYNAAAAEWLGPKKKQALHRRIGDVLDCVHAIESTGGCGSSDSCPSCGIRGPVNSASRGRRVTRRDTTFERRMGRKHDKVNLRVGCHPFTFEGHTFNLLILEGLNG